MSLARSLADLISGNSVIEATEIADNTITGGKLATDIVINTTGSITSGALTSCNLSYPTTDGTSGQVIQTDGAGNLTFATASGGGDVVDDLTPQLGGNLDLNANNITGSGSICYTGNLNVSGTSTFAGSLAVDTDALYVNCFSNNVGIGTAYPNSNLHIANSLDPTITLEDTCGDNQSRMRFITSTKCFVIGLHGGSSKFRISCGTVFGGSADWFSVCDTGQVDVTCNLVVGGALTACGLSYPTADGTSGQVIQTDGAGNLTFATVSGGSGLADVVDDTTPQLGGNLDLNGNNICGLGQICILSDLNEDMYIMRCSATCINLQLGVTDFSATVIKANGLKPFRIINASTESVHGIEFFTCDTERMRLTNAGYLGIGTTSAATKLHVENGEITVSDGTTCHKIGSKATSIFFGGNALVNLTTGSENTAFGENAAAGNTTGQWNTALGSLALYTNQTGSFNVAIGRGALYSNTGSYNVSIGVESSQNNTSGQSLTAIGRGALRFNTTGGCNTAIGDQSLFCNTIGTCNIGIGVCALFSNSSGTFNIGIGNASLSCLTTGTRHIGIGTGAGGSITGGYDNIAIGCGALASVITEHSNVAIGTCALNATTGYANVAIGRLALMNLTSSTTTAIGTEAGCSLTNGGFNTIVGAYAGKLYNASHGVLIGSEAGCNIASGDNIVAIGRCAHRGVASTGHSNVAIGYKSMSGVTTGRSSTALGFASLCSITTGMCNVAIGFETLVCQTDTSCSTAVGTCALKFNTGGGNTAVGFKVLPLNTTGVRNIMVGFETGLNNTTGSDNTSIGNSALVANTAGNANVAVGGQALKCATGSNNTAIGFYSGCNITSGSNLTTVGCGATASSATAANEVTLGNASVTCLRIPGLNFNIDSDGIKFNGDTAAANALDDYEEGTFTPTFSSGVTGSSYTYQTGRYTKIGNQVFFQIQITGNGLTTTTAQLQMSGLPFTSLNAAPYGGGAVNYSANFKSDGDITVHKGANDSILYFYNYDGSGLLGTETTNINASLLIHGQYITD